MFELTIKTGNSAFADGNTGPELARILRNLADRVERIGWDDSMGGAIKDANGNTVGNWYCDTTEGE